MFLMGGISTAYGKYEDVIPIAEKMAKGLELFVTALDKADSAAAVAAALDGYTKVMKELGPVMMELQKKYPELDKDDNVPEELKPVQKNIDVLVKKLGSLFPKIYKYISDPVVAEANKRWQEAMKIMDPGNKEEKEEKEE